MHDDIEKDGSHIHTTLINVQLTGHDKWRTELVSASRGYLVCTHQLELHSSYSYIMNAIHGGKNPIKKKKQNKCFPFCFTALLSHVIYGKMFPKALKMFISEKIPQG